ncbi:uncharacterized protein YwqG [Bacillus ectoiniformans]|uniref:YwqG family protein n=1 Tax=Bacillus ectoiniformans TaxID=1494429 RepID=UPI001957A249|nr:YwqG family protein [Bacillus ectoiniformans]MBM7647851.1 uncharacterized protein YwqG [Bacillus ectoiniformans]
MRDFVEKLIKKHQLEHKRQEILAELFTCISIQPVPTEDLATGRSKFGGTPDLPDSLTYPTYKNVPLNFIAQLNLTEMAELNYPNNPLPAAGFLYFFYYDNWEEDEDVIYGEPDQKEGWRVLFFDGDLSELSPVSKHSNPYPQCEMKFEVREKLDYFFMEPEEDEEKLIELMDEIYQEEESAHQTLGMPTSVQGEVFEEVSDYVDADEDDMVLLLQVDSDEENLDVMWGDMGMLYYCISKQDLADRKFERTWFSFQCH